MKQIIYTLTAIATLLLTGCADAGKNRTVPANTKVYFDISKVKPDVGGKITQYNWSLTGKAADIYDIYIFNNGTNHASFIAPNVNKETKLTFKLTSIESYKCKTDDDNSCKHHRSTDKVKMTITPNGTDGNSSTSNNDGKISLSGKITTLNNVALSGAIVNVNGKTTTTRNDGTYKLNNLSTDQRAIINVTHPNYFGNTRIVVTNQSGSYDQNIALDKENINITFPAQEGHNIADHSANINFEAGDYLDSNNKKYRENVHASMSYHNFKTSADTRAFVGSYETTDGSVESALLPYAFINLNITDDAGNKLTIAKDTTVTLAFPVADVSSNDETIPLWFYNNKLGYWLQEGSANRVNNQYQATISRVGTWALASVASKGSIQVCVVNKAGTALAGANIYASGSKWSSNLVQTDTEGFAVINTVRADTKLTIHASKVIGREKVSANYSKSVTLSAGDNINLDDCIVLASSEELQADRDLKAEEAKKKEEEAKKKEAEAKEKAAKDKAVEDAKVTELDKEAQAAQKKADEAKEASNKAKEAVIKAKNDLLNAKIALSSAKDSEKAAAEKKVKDAEATLEIKESEAEIAQSKATLAQDIANQAKAKAKR